MCAVRLDARWKWLKAPATVLPIWTSSSWCTSWAWSPPLQGPQGHFSPKTCSIHHFNTCHVNHDPWWQWCGDHQWSSVISRQSWWSSTTRSRPCCTFVPICWSAPWPWRFVVVNFQSSWPSACRRVKRLGHTKVVQQGVWCQFDVNLMRMNGSKPTNNNSFDHVDLRVTCALPICWRDAMDWK